MKNITLSLLLALLLCAPLASEARTKGFVIVIDPKSLSEARAEVEAYAGAIRDVNGLKVYTVEDKWGVPDSIRAMLQRARRDWNIVGAVFVGDIPVPMIRDAQHLSSAFKMSQSMPRKDSSIPSDRYYDDFSLRFVPLGHDEGTPLYYYSLTGASAQHVRPDIYTGRIRPTDAGGTSRYAKLRAYLSKVVREKRRTNRLDRILFFTGQGSLNDSRVAAMDEKTGFYDHFPHLRSDPHASITYVDFDQEKYIKPTLMNALQRADLDLSILHHHGDYDTQYLNREHKDVPDSVDRDLRDLHLRDFAAYGFAPNSRFVIFDACYNGAFQMPDCIANEYIFSPGSTVACMAGTVNLIQDKWYDRFIGLLSYGHTVGEINNYQEILESHIIGDPTFTFTPEKGISESATGDGKALSLLTRYRAGKVKSSELLNILRTAPEDQLRLQALKLIAEVNDSNTVKGLATAAYDRCEMVQRFAVNLIRDNSTPELAVPLVDLWTDAATSARVRSDAEMSIEYFPGDVLLKAYDKVMSQRQLVNRDSLDRRYVKRMEKYGDYWLKDVRELVADTLKDKSFRFTASAMRLYCPASGIPLILDYITAPHDDARRIALTEAIGWYGRSYLRDSIARTTLRMSRDNSLSPALRDEALKTYRRVTGQ